MNQRYHELDSLRGLAALAVVLAHAIAVTTSIPILLDYSPLHFFWASHEAVIFFFVLSGFVLSLPYYRGRNPDYLSYITKRVARIYFPYLASIIVTFAAFSIFAQENITGLGEWVESKWNHAPDFNTILNHALLLGNFQTSDYNPVIWSLIHEMRISLFFPLIMLLVIKKGMRTTLIVALLFSAIGGLNKIFGFEVSHGWHTSFLDTLHYSSMFMLGALLAKNIEALKRFYRSIARWRRVSLIVLVFFAYTYSRGVRVIPSEFMVVVADWGIALGVVIFIVAALSSPKLSAILNRKPLLMNGQLSYSCYLYHCIVLLALFHTLGSSVNTIIIYLISIPLIYLVSYCSWRFIELPSIKLGSLISKKVMGLSTVRTRER